MSEGYVNIQRYARQGIVTGGDIHPTLEQARRAASPFTIYQAKIIYPYPGEDTCVTASSVDLLSKNISSDAQTVVAKSPRKRKTKVS